LESKIVSTAPLGTWRRPPLAYVVAELVISPHYSLKGAVPQLQDALRADFPRTIEGTELVIDAASPPAAQPVWRLLSADQMRGVHISSRSLSMHATAYVDSADFLQRWKKILAAIDASKLGAFVERAGLRYLDLIVPSDGHEPKQYLIESLRGVTPPDGGAVQSSIWGTSILIDGFVVQVRTAAPSPPGMIFAPNFNALPLQKAQVMIDAERRAEANQLVGFIDTDCARDVQKVFDPSEILALYSRLHSQVSSLFNSVLSPLAKDEWI
jgi:uncharacterized protein (TIGR04255 family)